MSGTESSFRDDPVVRFALGMPGDAVILALPTGSIVCANEAAYALLGYGGEELAGSTIDRVVRGLGAAGSDSTPASLVEVECVAKGGAALHAEIAVSRVATKAGDVVCYAIRDTRHHKRAEQDLKAVQSRIARAERLETAGTVAGQIAHDFNNLLTPLLAYPNLIRRDLPPESKGRQYLDVMEKTAQDMSHITQQLLSLSRRAHTARETVNVNAVVEEVITLTQGTLPGAITVEFDLAEDLLYVRGAREQILRVLQNLCQNAIDAMGDAGLLRLTTENVYLDAPFGNYDFVKIGEYVKVTVSDTGPGIPPDIRDRIFDPFFTTKKASRRRGSGLGLSIVHGIVKDHDGYIDLDSVVGKGTTFCVYLPICRDAAPAQDRERSTGGSEAILIIDDDQPQIQVMLHLLKTLGYRATGVQSGEEAVRLLENPAEACDLVIVDMIMDTGMDGLETFRRIRALRPNLKVMLISGFEKARASVQEAQRLGAGTYLRKPVTLDRLASCVRAELELPRPGEEGSPRGGILIVDDEEPIRKLFRMIVQADLPNVRIDVAENGARALEVFRESDYGVVIMDLYMPVMDGRQAFSEIERLCRERDRPMPRVIFCTGFTLPESLNRIVADGRIHCLLRKPVKADALVRAVKERLR